MIKDKIIIVCSIICLALIIFFGPGPPKPPNGVDKRLKPYVDSFVREGKNRLGDCWDPYPIDIGIGSLEYLSIFSNEKGVRIVGICNVATKKIIIDSHAYTFLNKMELEEVVFHELGHCKLNRLKHVNEKVNGRPISMMYYLVLNPNIYIAYRKEYLDELFSTSKKCNK